jgi:hypothetical protein
MATLSISPAIPVPLTPLLGGTGVANANTNTLTLSSAGTLNLNSGTLAGTSGKTLTFQSTLTLTGVDSKVATFNNSLTFAGVDGKSLTINNSLTLAGTDATTMTFPGNSTTVAGLGVTGGQIFSTIQTIAPTGTGIVPLTITDASGSGAMSNYLQISITQATASSGLYIVHTNSTMANYSLIYLSAQQGSGNFTANFVQCLVNSVNKFVVSYLGAVTMAGGLAVGGGSVTAGAISINGSIFGDTSGRLFGAGFAPGAATSTAALGHVPTGQTTTAQSGWFLINVAGTVCRIPYWTNT